MESIDDILALMSERARTFTRASEPDSRDATLGDNVSREPGRDPISLAKEWAVSTPKLDAQQTTSSDVSTGAPARADIAIVAALQTPELSKLTEVFSDSWGKEIRDGTVYNVSALTFQDEVVTIVAAAQNDMGMIPAAILATKTIKAWRPKLLAMVGVCAGVKDKVALGDIIIGRQLFDYGSGKLVGGQLIPDYTPVLLDEQVCGYASDLASDTAALAEIRAAWPTDSGKPATDLQAHLGAMASGAAVVATDAVVQGIRDHKRSLCAIDMESYGVVRAAASSIRPPIALVVKGVQDFADEGKHDGYREYAAFVSAKFLKLFLTQYWATLRIPADSA